MYIGIDLGGTNIAAAIVDGGGVILKKTSVPTNARGGTKAVTDGLRSVCETLFEECGTGIKSVGIGVPGTANPETGVVAFTPNLPLSGVNITREISEKYGVPVYVGNDANCAALGEAYAGGARDTNSSVLITLGTGVGGGVILNKRLFAGFNGAAGEFGHMVTVAGGRKCGCGRLGCWETYASASGLITTASGIMPMFRDSFLWELSGGDMQKLDGRMVFDAFRAGDTAAVNAVDEYIGHLATGIVNIINIFEPETVCIGGGLSGAWDCMEKPLQAAADAEKYLRFSPTSPQTQIVRAVLAGDAGIIGAAMLGNM